MTSEGLILYVPGSNGVDFMRLEMVNQKLILEWNLGSGIGKIESNPKTTYLTPNFPKTYPEPKMAFQMAKVAKFG